MFHWEKVSKKEITEQYILQTNCITNRTEHPQDSSSTFPMAPAVITNSYARSVSESKDSGSDSDRRMEDYCNELTDISETFSTENIPLLYFTVNNHN